ncbi:MAG: N-acetylneuraminate synthase family protein [Pseudorhodoplanes sp.]|nr:N-acetylneuraminate synthase family protein [Pseudorhodoplanes sp.]
MIIERDIERYSVFVEDTVISALRKIDRNRARFVVAVTEAGRMEGIVTDGDIRRWLVAQNEVDLNQPLEGIINRLCVKGVADAPPESIEALFSTRIQFVPLVDRQMHLVGIASPGRASLQIGSFSIDELSPTFVIAEIGNNHNGNLELAKKLINLAAESGADCAKFQMRNLETLYTNKGNPNDVREDLGSQYTLDILSRFNLGSNELFEAFDHCRKVGILPLCTPWDLSSVAALHGYGIAGYKVASADLTNHELLEAIAATGKPILVSTGMSQENEIQEAVQLLRRVGAPFVLLHCNSTYPAPFNEIHLRYMDRLKEISSSVVGYSGHERGSHVAIAAVARGAKVIEKHFTIDRAMEGNDHRVSLLPNEFSEMVHAIRQVEQALGSGGVRRLGQGELMNRETLAKSLVAARDIAPGEVIAADMLAVKSPGKGLQPNRRKSLIGLRSRRAMSAGDFFFPSDTGEVAVAPRTYRFRRPWGVPVRFHDYAAIVENAKPQILEFHLSYKDLEIDPAEFLKAPLQSQLVVHSPELFAGDHLLDLTAANETHRRRSISEVERVVQLTRRLKQWFPETDRPLIITNVGGFTKDQPLLVTERPELYSRLAESLAVIGLEGVEIIPQTMPPFPWHFGGQQYHNLFVDEIETVDFCRRYGYRLCLDTSHSKLSCTHNRRSFHSYIEAVAPYAAHFHLVDARGTSEEGLQIGDGEIDWGDLANQLDAICPNVGFIPEVWQGHKNAGEGFWIALDRLERHF